ncbi:MAG: peptide transporter ATP-binding protein, partial [Pseudomonadota bacterium]
MTALLQIRGLTIDIDRDTGPARVVDGIDLTVDEGESLGVVGESGCGKSLTMLSLVGLLPNRIRTSGGTAHFAGRDLLQLSPADLRRVRGADIGFIFQDPMTSLNPVMRVGAQIAEALVWQTGLSKPAAMTRAEELLDLVGIPSPRDRLHAFPHELSGGMRQRVMIAIGLAGSPRLLIADEPTTALD